MKKITCLYPFKCRMYDICICAIKDKEPEKCKVRFDYEFQSRRSFIIGGMTWHDIEKAQSENAGKIENGG